MPSLPPPPFRQLYTLPELVRYADATTATARGWLRGYAYETPGGMHTAAPVAGVSTGASLRSFADLVEVAAISAARREGVPLQRLRIAISSARDIYGWPRPLLHQRFLHDGRDCFIKDPDTDDYVNLSRVGQIAWKHIADVLKDLDYESDMATRWWPHGRRGGILVDPAVSFGRPVIEPYGVSTIVVSERFKAGEAIDELADDYRIPRDLLERAIRYEQDPRPDA